MLACFLFGSAAWKAKARDTFIGWDAACRQRHLGRLTNNTRFLILPWVRVPHLASHLLSQVAAIFKRALISLARFHAVVASRISAFSSSDHDHDPFTPFSVCD